MKIKILPVLLICMAAVCSCSTENIAYMEKNTGSSANITENFDARIKVKDLLTISVTCSQPEIASPFNLTVSNPTTNRIGSSYTVTQPTLLPYQVDNDGYIKFPVIGKLKVLNMTKTEVEQLITNRLADYIKNEVPTVTMSWLNYKYSVLGEVARPNQYTSETGKVNIFEALSAAGDMTIYGRRDNVKLIREGNDGKRTTVELDLTRDDIVTSPYYYLQQNDIVYVEPNKARAKSSNISSATTIWLSVTSILLSAAALVVNITK